MKIPVKKLKSGFEMPVFGLGTWQMGGRLERNPENDDRKDITAIREAIKLGITHIDTAEQYAAGYAETIIGKAIEGLDRSKLFIVSKVSPQNLKYEDVFRSCEASLKHLKTDYLDLYLIHYPSLEIPIEETLKAMDKLVELGLIKNIGVSNFKTARLKEAQKHTKNKILVNQVYYNLKMRQPEHDGLLKHCQENDVFLEAYRPVEKGALLAQSTPILEKMAKKYGKTPAQIAINWLASQNNVITLAKSSSIEHLKENLGSIGWQMKDEDIENLRDNFPDQMERAENLPLI
jgi:diketogulonate reductase-like aldo/keto reductase